MKTTTVSHTPETLPPLTDAGCDHLAWLSERVDDVESHLGKRPDAGLNLVGAHDAEEEIRRQAILSLSS